VPIVGSSILLLATCFLNLQTFGAFGPLKIALFVIVYFHVLIAIEVACWYVAQRVGRWESAEEFVTAAGARTSLNAATLLRGRRVVASVFCVAPEHVRADDDARSLIRFAPLGPPLVSELADAFVQEFGRRSGTAKAATPGHSDISRLNVVGLISAFAEDGPPAHSIARR
jgi:hypothetical protein